MGTCFRYRTHGVSTHMTPPDTPHPHAMMIVRFNHQCGVVDNERVVSGGRVVALGGVREIPRAVGVSSSEGGGLGVLHSMRSNVSRRCTGT